ncbi:glycosyl transferase [Candidatus Levyibacteriota bacterium]|nr:glycosyltransferase family 2 protein [Candidatus Levybacteria bacterium]MSU26119.1 glycosyltransferase family 2 protein [Candidatus Levybacteria bacterium]GDX61794.1 glycosyl transferase [Candidatus Levybacteria bacterium]
MNNKKISVVISAYNEDSMIKDCLESVKWADEIIFINNSSQDNTINIAKKYTDNIFNRENNLMLNINKNFGFSKAKGEWILSLDADERISPQLVDEIQKKIKEDDRFTSYNIPRKNIIFGKWIEHAGWYPDYQIRLFKNGKGRFKEEHVHEMITSEGDVGTLENSLTHYNYTSIRQFIHKHANIYAPNEADQLLKNGYIFSWQDVIRLPFKEFLSRYFAREGYKDGFHGLILSLLMGFYHLVILSYIWEKKGFPQIVEANMIMVKDEIKKSSKDLNYWINDHDIKKEENIIKKIYKKIKYKYL